MKEKIYGTRFLKNLDILDTLKFISEDKNGEDIIKKWFKK